MTATSWGDTSAAALERLTPQQLATRLPAFWMHGRARLAGNPRMLLWAPVRSSAHLAAGDVTAALHHAEQAARQPTPPDFHAAGHPGRCLGAALTATGSPDRDVPAMLDAFGGPELPRVLPADRPAASADLVEAQLALGDIEAAEAALARAHVAAARAGTAPAKA